MTLKYNKRLGLMTNSTKTLKFDALTKEAWSYGHWKFCTKFNDKIIFNFYFYSSSTSKHQSKVRQRVNPDIFLRFTNQSLDNLQNALENEIFLAKRECVKLFNETKKKGTRKTTNEKRLEKIQDLIKHVKKLSLMFPENNRENFDITLSPVGLSLGGVL